MFYKLIINNNNKINRKKDDELRKFRNKVIHGGKIPSANESSTFGSDVLNFIQDYYSIIYNENDYLNNITKDKFKIDNQNDKNNDHEQSITLLSPGFQLIGTKNMSSISFDSILKKMKEFTENNNCWYKIYC